MLASCKVKQRTWLFYWGKRIRSIGQFIGLAMSLLPEWDEWRWWKVKLLSRLAVGCADRSQLVIENFLVSCHFLIFMTWFNFLSTLVWCHVRCPKVAEMASRVGRYQIGFTGDSCSLAQWLEVKSDAFQMHKVPAISHLTCAPTVCWVVWYAFGRCWQCWEVASFSWSCFSDDAIWDAL